MNHTFELKIPKTLRNVRLNQWVKFIDVYEKNKDSEDGDFLNRKMIEIFCEISMQDIYKIPISSFSSVLSHLTTILEAKTPLVRTFKLIGTDDVEVNFGLIPNLDKMSYGEWEDLESYIYNTKDLHKAMAVLYRPISYPKTFKEGDRYRIHEYRGSDSYSDIMRDMPTDVAIGAKVFFYRLAKKLGDYTIASTLKQFQKEQEGNLSKDSVENGEVIKRYMSSLEEMSQKLNKSPLFQSMNV
tara:strand:+ start:96 stop:818 length:723 start_codon:yes stop_codon:yes gene_type:complete